MWSKGWTFGLLNPVGSHLGPSGSPDHGLLQARIRRRKSYHLETEKYGHVVGMWSGLLAHPKTKGAILYLGYGHDEMESHQLKLT